MLKMSLADILNLLMIVLGLYAFFLLEFFVGPPVVVGAALRHIKSEYFYIFFILLLTTLVMPLADILINILLIVLGLSAFFLI